MKKKSKQYCHANFLSESVLNNILLIKKQFLNSLNDIGFITNEEIDNRNKNNEQLIKAIVCCGLYPNLAKIVQVYDEKGNVIETKYQTKTERCSLHPSTILISSEEEGRFSRKYIIFQEKVQTYEIYLRSCGVVSPWPILFFAKKIEMSELGYSITVDEWLEIESTGTNVVLVQRLRKELNKILADKIENPSLDVSEQEVIKTIIALFSEK